MCGESGGAARGLAGPENRWDNGQNAPWNSMERAAEVGQAKLLTTRTEDDPLLGTIPIITPEPQ